ncbi:MAG: hypothetical protein ACI3XC_08505 [Phascolarctobacterium sp.]
MARLGCICGAAMSTSVCPSPNKINIFTNGELTKALKETPDKLLWDFYSDDRDLEYWYCDECKRIYFVEAKSEGEIVKVFRPSAKSTEITLSFAELNFIELYVLFDTEIDAITELNYDMTISEYFASPSQYRYYYNGDLSEIYVFENTKLLLFYEEELTKN